MVATTFPTPEKIIESHVLGAIEQGSTVVPHKTEIVLHLEVLAFLTDI